MAEYSATTNSTIIRKYSEITSEINLQGYVERYKILRQEYLNLPKVKVTPDAETLAYFNQYVQDQTGRLKTRATILYNDLKPIHDAGLLPAKYNNEYTQLENFVNN